MNIIRTNLVELESLMLYTKIQPQSFLGSGEEDFKAFLPYMSVAAIFFNGMEPFKQAKRRPMEKNWRKLLKRFQRRRHLKITQFYYMYIAQAWARADNSKGIKFLL